MSVRFGLTRRIVTAFVLMSVAVAGLFSISVKLAVDYVEIRLMSESMNRHLDFILGETDQNTLSSLNLGPDMKLFRTRHGDDTDLPIFLHGLEPGFHEYEQRPDAYHILVREDEHGERYLLVLDQRDFEQRENQLQAIVAGGFLLCLIAAWVLGRLLARRVIAPVVRLSGQVQHRDQLLALAPPLAPDYADDEVGKLAMAFDTTLGRLRETLAREKLFTSDVSHELRTPLMVIASSCELLLEQSDPGDPRTRTIERIARASREMQELVETFLQLARGGERSSGQANRTAALVEIAEAQMRRWQADAKTRGLTLELVIEGEVQDELTGRSTAIGPIEPTEPRHHAAHGNHVGLSEHYPVAPLSTILSNLLRNAIHYTDRGFVRLVLRPGGISVIDSGVGIPAEIQARVFEAFVRGSESRGDGVGIGLSLVRRICDSQGWTVNLNTPAEGGCEFRVELMKQRSE